MINLNKEVNMNHLETWLGEEKIAKLRSDMKGWYGRPINIADLPGSVWIHADGTFTGKLNAGFFSSALDYLEDFNKRLNQSLLSSSFNVGFANISDALSRASQGYSQRRNFQKFGATGVVSGSSSLWRVGGQPGGGGAGAAAPGGTAHTSSNTGALAFANPASGTNHLVGADVSCTVTGNTLILYDRLFSVAKTMNSTTAEAVTGVPTRYQSTTASDPDFCGDNFLFVEVGGTALAATAHNWTTCTYINDLNSSATLPSLTGNASAIVDRFDHPTGQWFAPLASGDVGIKALTQIQCSASVATGVINFVIGHPIAWLSMPILNTNFPFDWLTNRDQAPRIFDNACLSFIESLKPTTTASSYTGRIVTTSAA